MKSFLTYLLVFTIILSAQDKIKLDSLFKRAKQYTAKENTEFSKAIKTCSDYINYSFPDSLKAIHYRTLGIICYQKSDFSDAKKYFYQSKDFFFAIKDTIKGAQVLSNISVINEIEGNYEESVKIYFKVMKIFDRFGNKRGLSFVNNNLSLVYQEMNNIALALKYQKQSLLLKTELKDTLGIASSYNNISVLFEENIKNIDSAFYYYTKSAKLFKAVNSESNYAKVLRNIAVIKIARNKFKDAEKDLNISKAIFEKNGNKLESSNVLRAIGLLNQKTGKYYQAEKDILQCLKSNIEFGYNKNISELRQQLASIYESQKKYSAALNEYKKYKALSDSISNDKKYKNISELEAKYQNLKKEEKIQTQNHKLELQKRNLREKNLFIIVVSLLLLILVVSGYFFFKFQHEKNILTKNDFEQKLLRTQMNPHFIFNALAAIQSYILKNETKNAYNYLGKFSSLSRSVLINSSKDAISLEEEIKMLKDYIELEKLRSDDMFIANISYDENEDLGYIFIPPMMIQPFIENAIKHGFKNIGTGGKLELNFKCFENTIQVEIIDNGIGIDSDKVIKDPKHKSMAMAIFQKRKELLQSKYKKSLTYKAIDLNKYEKTSGSKIIVTLPIIEK